MRRTSKSRAPKSSYLDKQSAAIEGVIDAEYTKNIDLEISKLFTESNEMSQQGDNKLKQDESELAQSPCFDGSEIITFAKVNHDSTPKRDKDGAVKLKGPIESINFMFPVFHTSAGEDFWGQYAFSEFQQTEFLNAFSITDDTFIRGALLKDGALASLLLKHKESVKQKNLEFFTKNPMLALRQMKLWQTAYENMKNIKAEKMILSFDNFFPRSVRNEKAYTAVFSKVLLEFANFKSYQNFKVAVLSGSARLDDAKHLPFDMKAASRKFSWDLSYDVSNPIELEIISSFKYFFGRTEFIDEYLRFN